MGLSTKQVNGDQGDWDQTLLQSGTAELTKPPSTRRQQPLQQQSEPLKCPRCSSTNTKFCYFNNYNKSQPRHFCKSCKRHWTKGGTLRNVPVGGGRKNKRLKISKASTTTSSSIAATVSTTNFPLNNNNIGDKKAMSNILYHSLIRSSSPSLHNTTNGINISIPEKPFLGNNGIINTTGLNLVSVPQIPRTEFPFSNLHTFDMNAPLINPTSYQSLNSYYHFSENLDSLKESTSTTVNTTVNIPSTSSMPLACLDTSSTVMDLPNYWNWNEIDVLTSSNDLNISWDDDGLEIKI